MIYYVTKASELYKSNRYTIISPEESLKLLHPLKYVGTDTETEGLDCHSKKLLSIQFGCRDFQVVIDCTTINPIIYKDYLESERIFLLWNANFDLKFFYKIGIFPNNIRDLMLSEKAIYLGYPSGMHSMALKEAAWKYLKKSLDKSVRGKIITQGLNEETIVYSAEDVEHLEDIMIAQQPELDNQNLNVALKLENEYVKINAYFEFCGARLDISKWKEKMKRDQENLNKAKDILDSWVVDWENDRISRESELVYLDVSKFRGDNVIEEDRKKLKFAKRRKESDIREKDGTLIAEAYEKEVKRKYSSINTQGDLFSGFDLTPKCTINWKSSAQVLLLFEELGIKCSTIDPKTKTSKKSINEKVIAPQQKNFPIIELYLNFKEAEKLVDSFGQKFLDFVNPATGRIHSTFHQFGTDTGRLSSTSPNLQQLPKDALTRSCFVAEKGNKWISCDYSGQESFIMASLSNDSAMLDELLRGSGDLHSLTARMVFEEIPDDTPLKEIKTKYHDLRQKAKGYEFCFNYGGNASTLVKNYGIDEDYAKSIYDNYMSGFDGLCRYQKNQRDFVNRYGYIILNKLGLRAHIYDFSDWEYLKQNNPREYRQRKAASEKQAINYKIQGSGAAMWKLAMVKIFNYIKKNNYLNIVKLCVPVHDEVNLEAPENIADEIASVVVTAMKSAGVYFCPNAPLDATCDIGDFWIHE